MAHAEWKGAGRARYRRGWVQHALEDKGNELDEKTLGKADNGHQDDGCDKGRRIRFRIAQQAVQIVQACASSNMRKRSSAAITRETLILLRPSGATTISDSVRQGPQMAGFEVLKRTTLGTPKAAAIWAGPLSFPMNTTLFEMTAFASASGPCTT